MSSENHFSNMYLKHLQRFGNVAQTFQQMLCKPFIPPLNKILWICLVFAGWITFTKRFKSTRKTISLNMVLATLLKHLPKLTVNVLKTSLKYFFITIFSNVWQTFSYCLMKCYPLIGKVFWKSIICKHFINVLETLSNVLITF